MPVKYCVWKRLWNGRLSVMGCCESKQEAVRLRNSLLKKAKNPKDVIIKKDRY